MKKVLFLLSFFFALGIATVNAQSCHGAAGKSCCADKAAKAAAADQTIEKRMNDDGTVAYVRKESDAKGNVQFVSVKFDEPSSTFVNVAPQTASTDATTTGMTHKACAMQGSGKACCAGKEGKACCAGKAAKADADQK